MDCFAPSAPSTRLLFWEGRGFRSSPSGTFSVQVACCSLLMLMRVLLMTSSHSKARSRVSYKAIGDSECQGHADCGVPCLDYLIVDLNAEMRNANSFLSKNQMRAAIAVGATLVIVAGLALIWKSRSNNGYEYIA